MKVESISRCDLCLLFERKLAWAIIRTSVTKPDVGIPVTRFPRKKKQNMRASLEGQSLLFYDEIKRSSPSICRKTSTVRRYLAKVRRFFLFPQGVGLAWRAQVQQILVTAPSIGLVIWRETGTITASHSPPEDGSGKLFTFIISQNKEALFSSVARIAHCG